MFIAFCGQKGGSGKTTTAIAVAAELVARGDRQVLLVDADPQGSTRTWADVAVEKGHRAPTVVAMGAAMHQPGQLDRLARGYDLTVIDCPPRHGDIQRAALMIADLAILPCGPTAMDVWALAESVALIAQAVSIRPELKAFALITRKIKRTTLGQGARDAMGAAGLKVMKTELCYRIAYQEAPAAGLGVTEYAPKDQAAVEVRALVDELLEELANGEKANAVAKEATNTRRSGSTNAIRRQRIR